MEIKIISGFAFVASARVSRTAMRFGRATDASSIECLDLLKGDTGLRTLMEVIQARRTNDKISEFIQQYNFVTHHYVITTIIAQNMSSRNDELTFCSMLEEVFMMYRKEMLIMQSTSEDAMKEKFRNLLAVAVDKDYLGVEKVAGAFRIYEATERGLSLSLDKILSADIFCNRLARTVKLFTDHSTTKNVLSSSALTQQDDNSIISKSSSGTSHGSIADSMKEDDASQESVECNESARSSYKERQKLREAIRVSYATVKIGPKDIDSRDLGVLAPRRASSGSSSSSSSATNVISRSLKSRHSVVEKPVDQISFDDDATSTRARIDAQRESRGDYLACQLHHAGLMRNITIITNIPARAPCYFTKARTFAITYSHVLFLHLVRLFLTSYSDLLFLFLIFVSYSLFLFPSLIPISPYARTASRPVRQISLVTGKTVRYYASLREAAHQMDIRVCDMVQCCMGNRKACGNFVWKYIDKYTDGK